MPPANGKQTQLKQKTLTNFFTKNVSTKKLSNGKSAEEVASSTSNSATESNIANPSVAVSPPTYKNSKRKAEKRDDIERLHSDAVEVSIRPPSSPLNMKNTPPTSDIIDVDMVSQVSDEEEFVPSNYTKRKKTVIEDSDEELAQTNGNARINSKNTAVSSAKRLRTSSPVEDTEMASSDASRFGSKLTMFKSNRSSTASVRSDSGISAFDDNSAPQRGRIAKGRSRSASSSRSRRTSTDNDDFIVDDDEASDADDTKGGSESELELRSKKSKYKSEQSAKRPKLKSNGADPSNPQAFLLTAAEQRTREKKTDKTEKDEPFSFLLDIRDKDRNRPGDPNYDLKTLYIPPSAWKTFTPFEKQFWEIKQKHYDTILFFQKGKFLELYEDDARTGHRLFDLKLTQRVKMSMVGVPEMSFNFWAAKFLAKGFKVGRVDQAETALGAEMRRTADKGKSSGDKLVRRELNKVYTIGTLVDGEMLVDDEAGHCIAIYEDSESNSFGICILDSATSQFDLCAFTDDVCRTKLETVMRQLRPKEIVYSKGNLSVPTTRLFKTILDGSCLWTALRPGEGFGFDGTLTRLREMFSDNDDMDENNGIPEAIRDMMGDKNAIIALGLMMWYLNQLNIDKDILTMGNFNIYDPMKAGKGLILDGQTLAHIEVLVNSDGTAEGSLLHLLGRCVTPFGKRLFRLWLCMPLRDIKQITARQNAVRDFIEHPTFETEFSKLARGMPDLERIVSRIHAKNCKVKEFLKVLECFKKLNKGFEGLSELAESLSSNSIRDLLRAAPALSSHIANVENMFEQPEGANVDELVPCEGKDDVYDQIQSDIKALEDELEGRLTTLQKKLGLSLKFWHSAQGTKEIYQVEASVNVTSKLPKSWSQTGSTKSVKRYSVPELEPLIKQLKEGRERRNSAVKEFKYRLYQEFDTDRSIWLRAVRIMAELDCLLSLAKSSIALGEPICRPELVDADSAFVDFEELRHPALSVKNDFIPNDIQLGGQAGRIVLLTGPNMAGKSTMMRMTAAGVIMAQLGMLVPAKRAKLVPLDSILTRMGAYDNMFGNASTFKVELDECCKILRDATPKSLVILDELGRGTSTFDGMAIAGAVLHHLATHTLPLSCFATHYSSLTGDFASHPNVRNMHMQTLVDDEKKELVFLYKLIDGVATGSFGTHVANLAGVPSEVVLRAEGISQDYAKKFKEKLLKKSNVGLPLTLQADFAFLWKLSTGRVTPSENTRNTLAILRNFIRNQKD